MLDGWMTAGRGAADEEDEEHHDDHKNKRNQGVLS